MVDAKNSTKNQSKKKKNISQHFSSLNTSHLMNNSALVLEPEDLEFDRRVDQNFIHREYTDYTNNPDPLENSNIPTFWRKADGKTPSFSNPIIEKVKEEITPQTQNVEKHSERESLNKVLTVADYELDQVQNKIDTIV